MILSTVPGRVVSRLRDRCLWRDYPRGIRECVYRRPIYERGLWRAGRV
jgi:hypothetical protein